MSKVAVVRMHLAYCYLYDDEAVQPVDLCNKILFSVSLMYAQFLNILGSLLICNYTPGFCFVHVIDLVSPFERFYA